MKRMRMWTAALFLATANGATASETETLKNYAGEVTATVTRDDQGRVIQIQQPDGLALYFYYTSGCLDRVVHGDGAVDKFDCDKAGNSIPKSFGHALESK
jgi:hypothetical protein